MPSGAYPARIRVQKSWPDRSEVNGRFLLFRQFLTPPPPAPGSALTAVPTAMNSAMSVPNSFISTSSRTPDDAVRAERGGLGFHPGHGQLPGVVHGLGQHVELLVLAPAADLQPDVVDRAAEDQAERPEPGLAHQQELVDRQVRGEDRTGLPRLQLGQPADRVLRDALRQARGSPALRCSARSGRKSSFSVRMLVSHGCRSSAPKPHPGRLAALRVEGQDREAAWPAAGCAPGANCAIAVPMMVTSTMWSLRRSCMGHSRSRTRRSIGLHHDAFRAHAGPRPAPAGSGRRAGPG